MRYSQSTEGCYRLWKAGKALGEGWVRGGGMSGTSRFLLPDVRNLGMGRRKLWTLEETAG